MRCLVCGGRDFIDSDKLHDILNQQGITHLIHGAARGADMLANKWAIAKGISITKYPAQWSRYGRSAGAIRNQQMLREGKPHKVIAFPGGRGTANMVKLARAAGLCVIKIKE